MGLARLTFENLLGRTAFYVLLVAFSSGRAESRLALQYPEERNAQNMLAEKQFSRSDLGACSALLLDKESASLYVGCRGFLGRLWAYNINDTNENVVRQFFLRGESESLLVCSSVAMRPELRVLHSTKLTDKEEPKTMIGLCSPDARVNGTAVHVEWGNPGEAATFYAGIRTGMAGENHLIYRPAISFPNGKQTDTLPAMRTIYSDSNWLNEPQFVASFDVGEFVYFFFREVAVEIGFAPPAVFSRVARVCKKDVGGKSVLRQVWSSFVKARLNCSVSGRFPFYFDHIQAVARVDSDGETLFYASMSTSDTAFPTSALCVFSLSAIEQLFGYGSFLEQQQSGVWLPTAADAVPAHRPGTCSPNSTLLSDSDLHFAKSHLLMAEPVDGGSPFLTTRDAFFHSVLVDVLPEQNAVMAVDHRDGRVWKVAHWREGGSYRWKLLQKLQLQQIQGRILATALLPHEFMYTSSSASGVAQFSLAPCSLHPSCQLCSIDPFCSWSLAAATCERREKARGTGWISSWAGRGSSECASSQVTQEKTVYEGDSLYLEGGADSEDEEGNVLSLWMKNGIPFIRDKTVEAADGGIVLMDITAEDAGEYSRNDKRYKITVDTECVRPTTLAGYHAAHREYCKQSATLRRESAEHESCLQGNQSPINMNIIS